MKRLGMMATCALCFLLGTIVPLKRTHAQISGSNQTYFVIDYMKSRTGQDPYKMERDLWKPIQRERLKNGEITSWSVMSPVLAGPHNYDYLTVTGYPSMESYSRTNFQTVFEKVWGKEKVQSSVNQTEQARDMLGSEMYVVVNGIGNSTK